MFNVENVTKVYSGKLHSCMCGCGGKYSYSAMGAEQDSPGYDVSDMVSERSVKIIAKKVMLNPNTKREGNLFILEDPSAGYAGNIKVVWVREAE
jgi:hypothetical protein